MVNELEVALDQALMHGDYEVALSCISDLLTQVEMEMEDETLSSTQRAELEGKALALYSKHCDIRSIIEGDWEYPEEF